LTAVFARVPEILQTRADAAQGTLKDVLAATTAMAQDPAFVSQSVPRVQAGGDPSLAVAQVAGQLIEMFSAAGGYMAERATDLASVRDRVFADLEGLPEPGVPALTHSSVVVAEDLSPADTAVLELSTVLGIVIEKGGSTSHTAIWHDGGHRSSCSDTR
jgi:phosphotransferase system enzyme I (PtsI)